MTQFGKAFFPPCFYSTSNCFDSFVRNLLLPIEKLFCGCQSLISPLTHSFNQTKSNIDICIWGKEVKHWEEKQLLCPAKRCAASKWATMGSIHGGTPENGGGFDHIQGPSSATQAAKWKLFDAIYRYLQQPNLNSTSFYQKSFSNTIISREHLERFY